MRNGDRKVGLIYLDTTESGHQFGESDLLFFSALSGMIAEKIENVSLTGIAREKRRLDHELGIAVTIQSRLLPSEIPPVAGYDITAYNRPCTEMGGDYFDIFAVGSSYVIVIGDVIGKGIGAAMLMANLQGMVRSRVTEYSDPSAMLEILNADLMSRIGDDMFITVCYLVLDPGNGEILYANAGHNQPLICQYTGEVTDLDVSGVPLGIVKESAYETFRGSLDPGDVLLLYTDGITECANMSGDLFGTELLKKCLSGSASKNADTIRSDLCTAVENFREGRPFSDDMTFIVVKRNGAHS
jgi:sigma-B regulation protein RsbU (phosphoserine phosphatase)